MYYATCAIPSYTQYKGKVYQQVSSKNCVLEICDISAVFFMIEKALKPSYLDFA